HPYREDTEPREHAREKSDRLLHVKALVNTLPQSVWTTSRRGVPQCHQAAGSVPVSGRARRSLAAIFTSEARESAFILHGLPSMRFHCDLADAELATNLFVQQAGNDQRHNLPLARGE